MTLDLRMVSLVSFCLFQNTERRYNMNTHLERDNNTGAISKYMNVTEIMDALDVSRPTAIRILKKHGMKHMKVGGTYKVLRADFNDWVLEHYFKPEDKQHVVGHVKTLDVIFFELSALDCEDIANVIIGATESLQEYDKTGIIEYRIFDNPDAQRCYNHIMDYNGFKKDGE